MSYVHRMIKQTIKEYQKKPINKGNNFLQVIRNNIPKHENKNLFRAIYCPKNKELLVAISRYQITIKMGNQEVNFPEEPRNGMKRREGKSEKVNHRCAVTSVSMNLRPSYLGTNLSPGLRCESDPEAFFSDPDPDPYASRKSITKP